jgi:hypothetical protein
MRRLYQNGCAVAIIVACPQCKKQYEVPERPASRRARCTCGAVVTLREAGESDVGREAATGQQSADQEPDLAAEAKDAGATGEMLRASLSVGLCSMLISLAIGGVLVVAVVSQSGPVVRAAEELRSVSSFRTPRAPIVLAAMMGGVFGYVAGWRLTEKAGVVGWVAWAVGAAGVGLLVVIAAVSFRFFCPGPLPEVLWACLVFMGFMGLLGITRWTLWAA